MNSKYFLRAFTGGFKVRNAIHISRSKRSVLTTALQEATSNVIELHDDKPDDFEALLKSIYTIDHDTDTFGDLIFANTKSVSSLVGLYVVADKYDVTRISAVAIQAARSALQTTEEDLAPAVKAYYNSTAAVDSEMGRAIAEKVIDPDLMSTANVEELVRSYPIFGADVGLALLQKYEPRVTRFCGNDHCDHENFVTAEMLDSLEDGYYCICGTLFYP